MNTALEAAVRNPNCTSCRLNEKATEVCGTGDGPDNAKILVVSTYASDRKKIEPLMEEAGLDISSVMWTAAIKCTNYAIDKIRAKDVKACREYVLGEIDHVKPEYVITFGNEALLSTTKRSGITKYRGKTFEITTDAGTKTRVFSTISPGAVYRTPGLKIGLVAELMFLSRQINGASVPYELTEDRVHTVETKEELQAFLEALRGADVAAYDVETTGFNEWDADASLVSLAVTLAKDDGKGMDSAQVWRVPLYHPQSVWRSQWQAVTKLIVRELVKVKKLVAHNAKFDAKWLTHFADQLMHVTFCTIMGISLINENSVKALKPLGQQTLGVPPWGIDTGDLLNTPLNEVLDYNGLDTWYDLALYFKERAALLKRPRQAKIFKTISMPLVNEFVRIERHGMWVDVEKVHTNREITQKVVDEQLAKLNKYVPPASEFPQDAKWIKKGMNWNVSHSLLWLLFEHLKLPVMKWGEEREDGSVMPSCDSEVLNRLADDGYEICKELLLYRESMKKINTFFDVYLELKDENDRLHTVYKPWAAATGRSSSGKEDREKATVTKADQLKGLNVQQTPRDQLVRGVWGVPPGFVLVQADMSQIELRIAAFLSRDPVLMQAYSTGQDVHAITASRITGKPISEITKEERYGSKPVNFGYLFGMQWKTFIEQAYRDYGLVFSEVEAKETRKVFFDLYKGLLPWHAKQRRLVNKYHRVQTPMGRIRHLPDILSPDEAVRAGAERQAINSPVQGFASDLTMWSIVLVGQRYRHLGMQAQVVGTIHDSIMVEAPEDEAQRAGKILKWTMENLPLQKHFGVALDVPIVADLEYGRYWGERDEEMQAMWS